MKVHVLYHANCSDGFCAAWLLEDIYHDAVFTPVKYGDPVPDGLDGCMVYIVDFSFPREDMIALSQRCDLTVLDHHKTAAEACAGLDFCIFDMNESGASLVWKYLYPSVDMPWIVRYVKDRDLWLWQEKKSREVNAALRAYPQDFRVWDGLLDRHSDMVLEGTAIERYRRSLIDRCKSHAYEATCAGHIVPHVNCSCGEIISDVVGELAEGRPFAVGWFDIEGKRVVSLRSRADGMDVSEIAKTFAGGGGHRNAAGFTLNLVRAV